MIQTERSHRARINADILNGLTAELDAAEKYLIRLRVMQQMYAELYSIADDTSPTRIPEPMWQQFEAVCDAHYHAWQTFETARAAAQEATEATL